MYSGHTFHTVLALLFILYLSKSTLEKSIVFVVALLNLTLIIASRIHYSCDVLVAILVTILIFYAWPGVDNVVRNILEGGIYGVMLKQTHVLK
jgi:membrane-associated phospholipid phosphatase